MSPPTGNRYHQPNPTTDLTLEAITEILKEDALHHYHNQTPHKDTSLPLLNITLHGKGSTAAIIIASNTKCWILTLDKGHIKIEEGIQQLDQGTERKETTIDLADPTIFQQITKIIPTASGAF